MRDSFVTEPQGAGTAEGATAVSAIPQRGPIVLALDIILIWVGFYAGWSLLSVPLTLAGAPFAALWGASAAALAGSFLAYRCRGWLAPVLLRPGVGRRLDFSLLRPGLAEIVALGAIAATALWFIPTSDARPLWAALVIVAVLALLRPVADQVEGAEVPEASETGYGAFLALVVGILALYMMILRPDADDAFYLNLPMGLIDSGRGMMATDTMYGIADWPFMLSTYRVETLPTLTAALSWASGLPVPLVHYLVLPAIWCLVWASTLALIGHGFFGRKWWIFALISVLAPMVLAGGSYHSWGVHGISRLFHGKGPLTLVVVPLIVFAVMRFDSARLGIGKSLGPLLGLQLAALGLTANAIYLAPLTLGLAVAAGWFARGGRGIDRFLLLLAATPPLLSGMWLLLFDAPRAANIGIDGEVSSKIYSDLYLWTHANTKLAVGLIVLIAVAALGAYRLGPRGRSPAAFLLAGLLFVINPFLLPYYDRFVTGGLSYRLYWALPAPMMLAAALTFLAIASGWEKSVASAVAAALVLLSFAPSGLLGMPGTSLAFSLTKRPSEMDARVAAIQDASGSDRLVIAPEEITAWLPTYDPPVPTVFVRFIYLPFLQGRIGAEEFSARLDLLLWMHGVRSPPVSEIVADLSAVCPELLVIDATSPDVRGNGLLDQLDAEEVGGVADMTLYSINPPDC